MAAPVLEISSPVNKAAEDPITNGNVDGSNTNGNVIPDKIGKIVARVTPKSQFVRGNSDGGSSAALKVPGSIARARNSIGPSPTHSPHYLRPSGSSCHDACKYGIRSHTEASDLNKPSRPHYSTPVKSSSPSAKPGTPPGLKTPVASKTPPFKTPDQSISKIPRAGTGTSSQDGRAGRTAKSSPNPRFRTLSSSVDSGIGALKNVPKNPSSRSTEKKMTRASVSVSPMKRASTGPKKSASMSPGRRLSTGTANLKPPVLSAKPADEQLRTNVKLYNPPKALGIGRGFSRGATSAVGVATTVAAGAGNKKVAPPNSKSNINKSQKETNQSNKPKKALSAKRDKALETTDVEPVLIETPEPPVVVSADEANNGANLGRMLDQPESISGSSDQDHENGTVKFVDDEKLDKGICDASTMMPYCPINDSDDVESDGLDSAEPYPQVIATAYDEQDLESPYSEYSDEFEDSQIDSDDDDPERITGGAGRARVEEGNDTSKKLRFRRGQELPPGTENQSMVRKKFRKARGITQSTEKAQPENVKLRHQDVQGRKAAEEFMLNHVIEETVQKLVPTKKSKVKALVGAFESVISLKEKESEAK